MSVSIWRAACQERGIARSRNRSRTSTEGSSRCRSRARVSHEHGTGIAPSLGTGAGRYSRPGPSGAAGCRPCGDKRVSPGARFVYAASVPQRVVAGFLKGRKLLQLPRTLDGVRPSSSRVRGAIFDRLQGEVVDARVLDLCAGTGALGIEALSRGAASATLVEKHPKVGAFLKQQVKALDLGSQARVAVADAVRFLSGAPTPYDLVLFDPPYVAQDLYEGVSGALAPWLADDAVVVCEYMPAALGGAPRWPAGLVTEASRPHGQTVLDFLRWDALHGEPTP